MPSELHLEVIAAALQPSFDRFRGVVAGTVEQIDRYLARYTGPTNGFRERVAVELGPFAERRIDLDRFGALVATSTLGGQAMEAMTDAREQLDRFGQMQGLIKGLVVDLPTGTNLSGAIGDILAGVGKVFRAARLFDQARGSMGEGREAIPDGQSTAGFPFARWSRRERALVPPIAVSVDGSDLQAGSLAGYLDGRVHLVLHVRGNASPAPLVRLITPGVFVQQTGEVDLERFLAWEGPAVTMLCSSPVARFVHDPGRGDRLTDRLQVTELPGMGTRDTIGTWSPRQQTEELRQLQALTQTVSETEPVAPSRSPASAESTTDPVDALAAWLLQQADLDRIPDSSVPSP